MKVAPIQREFAHALGVMTIYMQIPESYFEKMSSIYKFIGYQGQANSFAYCANINQSNPLLGDYCIPFEELDAHFRVENLFCC